MEVPSVVWPIFGLIAIVGIGIYAERYRQRKIEATTHVCPTCHGLGRINREPQP